MSTIIAVTTKLLVPDTEMGHKYIDAYLMKYGKQGIDVDVHETENGIELTRLHFTSIDENWDGKIVD